jgi:hypothetical protein
MLTIGKKRPKESPRGDYVAKCDYCGTHYLRSALRMDGSGLLRCRLEGNGLDQTTLSKGNAMANRPPSPPPPRRGGAAVKADPFAPSDPHKTDWT